MNVAVVINRRTELGPRQTTTLLIAALLRAQHQVYLSSVDEFITSGPPSSVASSVFSAVALNEYAFLTNADDSYWEAIVNVASQPAKYRTSMTKCDLLLIRTNPGRDTTRQELHHEFLRRACAIENAGICVINSPRFLPRMADKSTLQEVDSRYRPRSLVSADLAQISRFIHELNRACVIKPLVGSRGQNVIRVTPQQSDLDATILAAVTANRVIVQEFVSDGLPSDGISVGGFSGDMRIVCVGGQVLELNGHAAAIRRSPADGDFRANLHAGGTAHPAELTTEMYEAANHASQFLERHGVWLAGIDIVGDKIIEFNVFSTGGLYHAQRFTNQDFSAEIVARLTAKVP